MDDLISRQAAIDLPKQMRKDGDMVPWEGKNVFARIRELPTIQPEQLGTNLAEVGTDCISRQDAIDMIRNHWSDFSNADNYRTAKACVDAVPPAQPKRGKCKWCERLKERNLRIEYYWIDQEGCTASFSEPHVVATGIANFCPNCGAKMEVTE